MPLLPPVTPVTILRSQQSPLSLVVKGPRLLRCSALGKWQCTRQVTFRQMWSQSGMAGGARTLVAMYTPSHDTEILNCTPGSCYTRSLPCRRPETMQQI